MPLITHPKMLTCPELRRVTGTRPQCSPKISARVPIRKAIWALLLLILGVAGCGSTYTPPPPTLTSLAVTPANMSVSAGTKQQMKATGTFSDGSTSDLTASVTWTSSDTSLATVDSSRLFSPGAS